MAGQQQKAGGGEGKDRGGPIEGVVVEM